MADITTRRVKGEPLTNDELDDNFDNLNDDKMEKSANLADVTDPAAARENIQVYGKGTSLGLILALG